MWAVDAIIESLKAAAVYNRDDVEPPAAILWPDEKREWECLVPRLRMVLPQFLVLGPYNKTNRTGPAIWLRCVLGRRIPEVDLPLIVPIVYLPGVSRLSLRATEECPPELKPLAELQYRGVFWSCQVGSLRGWRTCQKEPASSLQMACGSTWGKSSRRCLKAARTLFS